VTDASGSQEPADAMHAADAMGAPDTAPLARNRPVRSRGGARRGPRAQATRDALIEVGLKLFLEKGYRQTSIQEIVDTAGVTKGAFYHHFAAKDDVLILAHETYLRKQLAIINAVLAEGMDAASSLRKIIYEMLNGVIEHRAEVSLFLEERRSLRGARFEAVRLLRREFEVAFTDLIKSGVEDGQFANSAEESRVIALGLLGMVSWTYQWLRGDGLQSREDVARVFSDMVLQGLVRRDVPATQEPSRPSREGIKKWLLGNS
jgi:TetR/AcrR family transcriptional regulator, cholesterol catabolism regulator